MWCTCCLPCGRVLPNYVDLNCSTSSRMKLIEKSIVFFSFLPMPMNFRPIIFAPMCNTCRSISSETCTSSLSQLAGAGFTLVPRRADRKRLEIAGNLPARRVSAPLMTLRRHKDATVNTHRARRRDRVTSRTDGVTSRPVTARR